VQPDGVGDGSAAVAHPGGGSGDPVIDLDTPDLLDDLETTPPPRPAPAEAVATDGIEVLRWPADAARREELVLERRPRLLLVEPGATPPPPDGHEDWIRMPADQRDVSARLGRLARRHGTHDGRGTHGARDEQHAGVPHDLRTPPPASAPCGAPEHSQEDTWRIW
jgi:hypothetical protein